MHLYPSKRRALHVFCHEDSLRIVLIGGQVLWWQEKGTFTLCNGFGLVIEGEQRNLSLCQYYALQPPRKAI